MGTAYPGPKIHYPSRRRPGRPVTAPPIGTAVTITGSGSVATLTFARPVTITGTIPLLVPTLTLVSQAIVSPTVATITYSGPVSGLTYLLEANPPTAMTRQGGAVYGASGTFRRPTTRPRNLAQRHQQRRRAILPVLVPGLRYSQLSQPRAEPTLLVAQCRHMARMHLAPANRQRRHELHRRHPPN